VTPPLVSSLKLFTCILTSIGYANDAHIWSTILLTYFDVHHFFFSHCHISFLTNELTITSPPRKKFCYSRVVIYEY